MVVPSYAKFGALYNSGLLVASTVPVLGRAVNLSCCGRLAFLCSRGCAAGTPQCCATPWASPLLATVVLGAVLKKRSLHCRCIVLTDRSHQ